MTDHSQSSKDDKAKRLAEALRANLRRRKQQSRESKAVDQKVDPNDA